RCACQYVHVETSRPADGARDRAPLRLPRGEVEPRPDVRLPLDAAERVALHLQSHDHKKPIGPHRELLLPEQAGHRITTSLRVEGDQRRTKGAVPVHSKSTAPDDVVSGARGKGVLEV